MSNLVTSSQEALEKLFEKNSEKFYLIAIEWNKHKAAHALGVKKLYDTSDGTAMDKTGKVTFTWAPAEDGLRFRLFNRGKCITSFIVKKRELLSEFARYKEDIEHAKRYECENKKFPFKKAATKEDIIKLFSGNEFCKDVLEQKSVKKATSHKKNNKHHEKTSRRNSGHLHGNVSYG